MEYYEAVNFLFDLRRFRMKPGTAETKRLLDVLNEPHSDIDFVQVAGSNGKGSTVRMLDSILRQAGLTVGAYTSPHVEDLRDRITVNGRAIPEAALCEFVETIQDFVRERAAAGNGPTFFEVLTALAIWHFGQENVDIAVLEVGIGGKHDATSVISPVASAVTDVSLEHTEVLGDSIDEIARDKAHVAPADNPLVTATAGEGLEAVRDEAGEVLTVCTTAGTNSDVAVTYEGVDGIESVVEIEGGDWSIRTRLPLLGAHQARNAGVAAALARQITAVSPDALSRGLRSSHWPGRFEIMDREPFIVLDGAHNPAACNAVTATLDEFRYDELVVVFGAMHDKDHAGMVEALPSADQVYTVEPVVDRAEDSEVLARVFEAAGADDVVSVGGVETAVTRAIASAGDTDCILVTGSLYTVREARSHWTRRAIPKQIQTKREAEELLADAHTGSGSIARGSPETVHRVLKTVGRSRQAEALKEAMLAVGGRCVRSNIEDHDGEQAPVVVSGTESQFDAALTTLQNAHPAGHGVASTLRRALSNTHPSASGTVSWLDTPAVMGILNVTPDSFYDGGKFDRESDAVAHAKAMAAAGADIIDVGGESTRPGADPVSATEERKRVVPVIEAISDLDVLISIDTQKATVAEAALEAGADIVNDVSGLGDPEMRFVVADYDAPLVVMHSIDAPVVPDKEIVYDDVVEDVIESLAEQIRLAEQAGVDRSQIVVDPGLGFGKTEPENFELLKRLHEFRALGCPVLVGHSHKSMFELLGYGPEDRTAATIGATAMAVANGADIIRVHDVPENVAAVRTATAVQNPDAAGYSE